MNPQRNQFNTRQILASSLAVACLALGACSSGGGRHYVAERERVYRDSDSVCRETTVTERGSDDRAERAAGTIAGAVVGGVIGNQIGDGRGRDAARLGGAAAGAYAGNRLADRDDDRSVRRTETRVVCRDR